VQPEFEPIFATAGCAGSLCVQDAAGQVEVGISPDQPFVAASVIKVLVAVEVERQLAAGWLDPFERVHLSAKARTPGPVGFSFYEDDVEVSLRDLLVPMLTISDNVATDALLARVGLASCNATAITLGLHQTVIEHDLHTMIDSIGQAAGFANWDALVAWDAQPHPANEEAVVRERVRNAAAMQPQTATTCVDCCA
jgi:beta-lactamase class A